MPRRKRAVIAPKRVLSVASKTRFALDRIKHSGPSLEMLRMGLDSSALRGLFDKRLYAGQAPGPGVEKLQDFMHNWVDKNAKLNISMHEQAKKLAEKDKIKEYIAFNKILMLEKNRKFIERRLSEKAALEQLLFVLNRHRLAAKGKATGFVEPTKAVREWASKFYNPKDLPGSFVKLTEAVSRIPMMNAPKEIAEMYYALPTAEETIIADSIITVLNRKGEPAWGCGMQCNVINAVLNAWKWQNSQVRIKTELGYVHSVTIAQVPGRKLWLVADPFRNGREFLGMFENYRHSSLVSQVGIKLGEHIKAMQAKGNWKVGESLQDFVKNFGEFDRER